MDVKWGISEEWLCPPCERRRAETKAKELQAGAMASATDVNSPPGDLETHTAGGGDAALEEGDTPGQGSRETSQNCKSEANHRNTRSRRSQSVAADPPAMCIPGCKSRKGKVAGDKLAHCCLCGHRFHTKCLNMKDDDVTTVWTCIACRGMPSNVR